MPGDLNADVRLIEEEAGVAWTAACAPGQPAM